MMNHSARPAGTSIVFEEPNIDISDHADIPPIRRHRPVTALVRRRSSKLAQLVQSVVDERGGDEEDDHDGETWRMSAAARRAASAPHRHRMSINSFYADIQEDASASPEPEPDTIEQPVRNLRTKRNSVQIQPDKPILIPRSSFHRPSLNSMRPTLRPKTALIKKPLPKRKDSSSPDKSKRKGDDKEEGSDEDSDSDTDSDSSLSTLESLKELKNRIDEIVGTRPVYASRTVRRGSASHIMRLGQKKKKEEEKSEMTADAVMMRRRPAMISIDSRSKSLSNVRGGQENNNNTTNSVPIRTRSASLAATNALPPRTRSARASHISRKRAQSLTDAADGQKSPAMQMFESRRTSISNTFKDANGNVSYRTRKNLRRGSLFAESRSASRADDGDDNRRGSLMVPDDIPLGHRDSFEGFRRGSAAGRSRRSPIPEDLQLPVPDPISVVSLIEHS